MNQRTFLGLTHNPFVPPKEGFFNGADRKTHLEHLRHLSQWSRRILVVSGPFGIGKSSLFRELSSNLEPHTKAARLAGTVVTSEREVLSALLQGFGVAADAAAGADDLSRVIARFVDEQDNNGRACMVMVDDGHLLEPLALQRLISLVADSSLRMVVFAETMVIGAIDRDAKAANLEWFEIRLTGFPKTDVRDYLEWRFSQAQYRGLLPFTDEQVETIVTKSSGNPGVVDSLASNLLIEMETGQIRNRGAGFPVMHGVLALLLVAFVGLLYVWFQQVSEDTPDVAAADSGVPPVELQNDVQAGAQNNVPDQVEAEPQAPATPPASTPQVSVSQENKQPGAAVSDQRQDEWVKEEFGGVEPAPANARGTPATEVTPQPETQREQVQNQEQLAQTELPVQPEREEQKEPESSTSRQGSVVPVVQSSPAATPAATPAEPQGQAGGGIKNGNWLLDQDPRRFTVQLVTVSRPERARELINEQDNPAEFAVYQINRDGRRLNVITYGVFSNSAAASAAAGQLSGQLGTVKPWVRPMNLVQDAVRAGL